MKAKIKISILLLLFVCSQSYGQIGQYSYKRELTGITSQWHKIELKDGIFGKVSQDLSDIRIYGLTEGRDTIEAPYLIERTEEEIVSREINFKMLNTSHNNKGYYYTFEIKGKETINQIMLNFKQDNFDWRVKVEGSQNQEEWFTIVDNYRIISIKNSFTDYEFTKLSIPESNYRYFRLLINSKTKSGLESASIGLNEVTEGLYKVYGIQQYKLEDIKQTKQTEITFNLKHPVPVCYLKLNIKNTFDYYRPVTIKYLTDSVKTEQGWIYNYSTLANGTLNSIESNEFRFPGTILQKIKVIIRNNDNEALTIDSIEVKGYIHELVARFNKTADYYLVYGNKYSRKPSYDIARFADKIPDNLTTLSLGEEEAILKTETPPIKPLFNNMIWLWVIMALIIVLLGWFSVKMIKNK